MRAPLSRRSLSRGALAALAVGVLVGLVGGEARADTFDLALHRLVPGPKEPGGFAESTQLLAQTEYRQLMSELSVALAPKFLTTADTLGYSGFQFTVDYSLTTIGNQCRFDPSDLTNPATNQCPWGRGVEGGNMAGSTGIPPLAHTMSIYARKGIWLPLPSFEIGAGATKLMQSDIYAVQVYAKFSLHEGFHKWPLPSIAVRGSGMRVLGASQVDLTMAQVDASLSKVFGVAGTLSITPYLGAAALFVVAKGQVLDTTPHIDSFRQGPGSLDLNANAVFPDQDTIIRWRFFGGLRFVYSILVFTTDVVITPGGNLGVKTTAIPDRSTLQTTFSASIGLLF